MRRAPLPRLSTGVPNLDALCEGGLPRESLIVVAGPPGSGKTVLAQQICFNAAKNGDRVLYLNTLSESTAKTLRYLGQFEFFDQAAFGDRVDFVDLGSALRDKDLSAIPELVVSHIKRVQPTLVVIDSFKVFDDLARSGGELRKVSYDVAVRLMAWECTTLMLGEFPVTTLESNPIFSIVDGLIKLAQHESSGEEQRFLQIVKLRGTNHSRESHPFSITDAGLEVFPSRVTIQRDARDSNVLGEPVRCQTGITKFDTLLGPGIPEGSSLLVAGVAGTGKTVLLLEFIYRGAKQFGEKGVLFSFEETEARLRATGRGLGWDLDEQIAKGLVEIVFIPQPLIQVEQDLLMMHRRVMAFGAKRVAIDSVSVFLHKVKDPQIAREKIFQLATVIQNARAVGLFATDIPYGTQQVSRFGVEETVVDGVVLLTSTEEGFERQRYLEVYKLRNTAHLKGRHNMVIERGGIGLFPRYESQPQLEIPTAVESDVRLPAGVQGLDTMLGGGVLARSVTLVSGSAGVGKTTLAVQFILAGATRGEPGLYLALEEGPGQIINSAGLIGLSLGDSVTAGTTHMMYLSRQEVRGSQLLAILSDRIAALGIKRLVIDSAGHLAGAGSRSDDLAALLYQLSVRFKSLGVTTLLTLESPSLFAIDSATDRGLSPIADNLIALRYANAEGEMRRTITVVKTRGSSHDPMTHAFAIGDTGIVIGNRERSGPWQQPS